MCCKTLERKSLWQCLGLSKVDITINENIAMEFVPVWFVLNYRLISRKNIITDFVAYNSITNHTLSLKYDRFLPKHPVHNTHSSMNVINSFQTADQPISFYNFFTVNKTRYICINILSINSIISVLTSCLY